MPRRGLGYANALGTVTPVFWDVGFRFTMAEAWAFYTWFVYLIERGRREFLMPIRTEFGLIEHSLQFLPGTLLDLREEGEVFTYRATVMARAEILP
jgi:hypothetical protein